MNSNLYTSQEAANRLIQADERALTFTVVSLAAGTAETPIWTPTTGKKFRLIGFALTSGSTSSLMLKDGVGGSTIFQTRGANNSPIVVNLGSGLPSSTINNVLTVTRGTSGTLEGTVWGYEE